MIRITTIIVQLTEKLTKIRKRVKITNTRLSLSNLIK